MRLVDELPCATNGRSRVPHQLNKGALLKLCRTFAACLADRSRDGHGESAAPRRRTPVLRCRHPSRGEHRRVDRRGAETRICRYLPDRTPLTAGSVRQRTGCERLPSRPLPNRRRLSSPPKRRGTVPSSPKRGPARDLQRKTREEHATRFRRHRRICGHAMLDGSPRASRYDHHASPAVVSPRQLRPKAARVPPATGAGSIFCSGVAVFHDEASTADRKASLPSRWSAVNEEQESELFDFRECSGAERIGHPTRLSAASSRSACPRSVRSR